MMTLPGKGKSITLDRQTEALFTASFMKTNLNIGDLVILDNGFYGELKHLYVDETGNIIAVLELSKQFQQYTADEKSFIRLFVAHTDGLRLMGSPKE